jgi:NhaP-type Na+/H+ or K+/H+ antiporter
MTNYDANHGDNATIEIDIMKILLFTALICSNDLVATISIVSYEAQPKLFSCIFGEGVFNDAVSIILFNTMENLQGTTFYWYSPLIIMVEFLLLGVISVSVGLLFGICSSLLFKHARFLTFSPIIETFLVFVSCYASYFVTNMIKLPNSTLEMSGIIAICTCGIVTAHYTYYNLSFNGKQGTTFSFSLLGEATEAAIYSYVGLALYSTIPTWWSWSFIFVQLIIVVGGRLLAVISTFYCFRLCFKSQTINFRELLFIAYAGMIRGAVAFALVLKIEFNGRDGVTCEHCYSQ